MEEIRGFVVYNDVVAMQHENVFEVMEEFFRTVRPKRVLEIGTASGGFTLFIKDCLNKLGLQDSEVISYDIHTTGTHQKLLENGIDLRIRNLFNDSHTELKLHDELNSILSNEGVSIVFCDGGNKILEFNLISDYLKSGDFILAHDYARDVDYFNNNIKNKIWNWCEITENYISESCQRNNLSDYEFDKFQSVVWVCKKKN